jgi:hypothetical protein
MNMIETCTKYCYEGRGKPNVIYVIMLQKYDEEMSWNCSVNIRLIIVNQRKTKSSRNTIVSGQSCPQDVNKSTKG